MFVLSLSGLNCIYANCGVGICHMEGDGEGAYNFGSGMAIELQLRQLAPEAITTIDILQYSACAFCKFIALSNKYRGTDKETGMMFSS